MRRAIPETRHTPTQVQLFRFSAATWNAHRIHYDRGYAEHEGYPDVLVQSHLHGCLLLQTAVAWAGPLAELESFGWDNRSISIPGEELVCTGTVVATQAVSAKRELATVELVSRNPKGTVVATGRAVFAFDLEARHD